MGVDALPLVMGKIKAGDDRFVPLVNQIMGEDIGASCGIGSAVVVDERRSRATSRSVVGK